MEITLKTDGGFGTNVDADAAKRCKSEVMLALANGADYEDIADIVSGDLGLEMDYITDILGL